MLARIVVVIALTSTRTLTTNSSTLAWSIAFGVSVVLMALHPFCSPEASPRLTDSLSRTTVLVAVQPVKGAEGDIRLRLVADPQDPLMVRVGEQREVSDSPSRSRRSARTLTSRSPTSGGS